MAKKENKDEGQAAPSTAATYEKTPEELAAVAAEAGTKTKAEGSQPETKAGEAKKETRKPTKLESAAAKILKEHPDQDKVHMTTDGFGYFNEHDAWNHARTLEDKEVITIMR